MNPNQSTDKVNGDKAAGTTSPSNLTPRESGARIGLSTGKTGENADQGNRNKRS